MNLTEMLATGFLFMIGAEGARRVIVTVDRILTDRRISFRDYKDKEENKELLTKVFSKPDKYQGA